MGRYEAERQVHFSPGTILFYRFDTFHRGTPVVEGRCRRIHSIVTPPRPPLSFGLHLLRYSQEMIVRTGLPARGLPLDPVGCLGQAPRPAVGDARAAAQRLAEERPRLPEVRQHTDIYRSSTKKLSQICAS